jgi:sec-independent protein translocase protein TatB
MLSIPHLVVIFIVALVVFGPEKIPELARNLGKVMAEFRRVTGDLRSTFEGHLRDLEREADSRRIAAVPAPTVATAPAAAAAPPANPPVSGTVASKPPNSPALEGKPEAVPDSPAPNAAQYPLPGPGEPMHDPYMTHLDLNPPDDPDTTRPEPDPENKSERVSDGDRRVS